MCSLLACAVLRIMESRLPLRRGSLTYSWQFVGRSNLRASASVRLGVAAVHGTHLSFKYRGRRWHQTLVLLVTSSSSSTRVLGTLGKRKRTPVVELHRALDGVGGLLDIPELERREAYGRRVVDEMRAEARGPGLRFLGLQPTNIKGSEIGGVLWGTHTKSKHSENSATKITWPVRV